MFAGGARRGVQAITLAAVAGVLGYAIVLTVTSSSPGSKPSGGAAPAPLLPGPIPTSIWVVTAQPSRAPSPAASHTVLVRSPGPAGVPVRPDHLAIASIGLNTTVAPGVSVAQYDPHTGRTVITFPVPADLYSATWWQGGPDGGGGFAAAPEPGSSGAAVLTLHSSLGDHGYGAGNELPRLVRGRAILISGVDVHGQQRQLTFRVLSVRSGLNKADPAALRNALTGAPSGTRLILITCSGSVDTALSSSNFNSVVYAALA